MIALRIGLLVALGSTLALAENDAIKCPGGECVKLLLCREGTIVTDGSYLIDIRFNPDDPCDHYLLKCCATPDGEDDDIIEPPSTGDTEFIEPPSSGPHSENQIGSNSGSSTSTGSSGSVGSSSSGGSFGSAGSSGSEGSSGSAGSSSSAGSSGPTGSSGSVPSGPSESSGGHGREQEGAIGNPGTTVNPILPPQENVGCGFRNPDGVGFRITGNSDGEAEYGEFPWMVAILKEEKALDQVINVYQCGGSLIHPRVVLTAAHCVQNKQPHEIKVRLGEWDTQTTNEIHDHQDRNVAEIVVHDKFYKGGLFNDFALLFLDKPAEIIDTVNTVCLPPQDFNFDLSRCFASGWGKDVFGKEGTYQVILKKIELPVMPFNKCQEALRTTRLGKRFILNKSFICAGGEPKKDTCKGDGGSPLVCPIPGSPNRFYQAGIVAWGIGCGEHGVPGVYANVAGFRTWIDGHLTQRSIPHDYYIAV